MAPDGPDGPDDLEDRLTAHALRAGDPTGWFEHFYQAGQTGEVAMPWARTEPHRLLAEWARDRDLDGTGQRAIVVGCALGADAEFVSGLGYRTIAFDVAETAVRAARQRFSRSAVEYRTADLLQPPHCWWHAFDLVVEIITVQAMPDPPQHQAIVNVGRLVGPGGTLFAVEGVRGDDEPAAELGPWTLTRSAVGAFAADGLVPVRIELTGEPGSADVRWRAEFRRPPAGG